MDKLGGGAGLISPPPAYLSPGMLFPHLHYPALLAHHAQLIQQREKSAFSPDKSAFSPEKSAFSPIVSKGSMSSSPDTPPSPPMDSPPSPGGHFEDDKSVIARLLPHPPLSGKK
jgi:hypothetical protein